MTPEQLEKEEYSGVDADLFACAKIIFTMITQHFPFEIASTSSSAFYRCIWREKFTVYWKHADKENQVCPDLRDLLQSMMSYDPSKRLSVAEILEHPWMKGPIISDHDFQNEIIKRKVSMKYAVRYEAIIYNLINHLFITKYANYLLSLWIGSLLVNY